MKSEPNASIAGTSRVGNFRATYKELFDLFGEPVESDGYKVSTEWKVRYFEKIYTIYDYKETNLYSDELPSVEEFRSDKNPKLWGVGGFAYSELFILELHRQLTLIK